MINIPLADESTFPTSEMLMVFQPTLMPILIYGFSIRRELIITTHRERDGRTKLTFRIVELTKKRCRNRKLPQSKRGYNNCSGLVQYC